MKRTEDGAICLFDLSGILECSFAEHASLLNGGMSGKVNATTGSTDLSTSFKPLLFFPLLRLCPSGLGFGEFSLVETSQKFPIEEDCESKSR